MIDQKRLKELVKLMVENDLTELDLQAEGEKVLLKRGGRVEPQVQYVAAPPPVAAPAPPQGSVTAAAAPAEGEVGKRITSPMVGTF